MDPKRGTKRRLSEDSTSGDDSRSNDGTVDSKFSLSDSSAQTWLRNFQGASAIAMTFGRDGYLDSTSYVFPRCVLEDNFAYFKASLGRDIITGPTEQLRLGHVESRIFARILKYVLEPECYTLDQDIWETIKDDEIDELLQLIIAVDRLGFIHIKAFETIICERLALSLLNWRVNLTSEHLGQIATHQAFGSKNIWQVVGAAGVRPLLQEHLVGAHPSEPPNHVPGQVEADGIHYHNCGNDDPADWDKTIAHYQRLRNDNPDYALAVTNRIPRVLKDGAEKFKSDKSKNQTVPHYTDPLLSFISFEPTFDDMSTKFKL